MQLNAKELFGPSRRWFQLQRQEKQSETSYVNEADDNTTEEDIIAHMKKRCRDELAHLSEQMQKQTDPESRQGLLDEEINMQQWTAILLSVHCGALTSSLLMGLLERGWDSSSAVRYERCFLVNLYNGKSVYFNPIFILTFHQRPWFTKLKIIIIIF